MRAPCPTTFPALDGLRGAAALGVFALHLMILDSRESEAWFHGYLAVDLFFMLSGFVVAHAYERRLQDGALSFGGFVRLRLTRLWPLAALGTALGVALVGTLAETAAAGPLWALTAASLALAPWFASDRLFTLDGPLWSLSVEVAANLLYARWVRAATTPRLLALSALCFAPLAAWTLSTGSLSLGWTPQTWLAGVLRIGFAFPLGVVMRRRLATLPRLDLGVTPACLLLGLVFWAPRLLPAHGWRGAYDLLAIAVVFPALIAAAARARPSPWEVWACRVAGGLSYPLYAVHEPVLRAAAAQAEPFGRAGVAALALAVAVLAWRGFDAPLQAWLRRPVLRRARA